MLRNIFRDPYSWTFVTPTFLALVCIVHFSSCSHSLESEYPVVSLPSDADTTSPIWKGIDLEPKPPVKAKNPADQQLTFQLPPGYVIEPILTEPQIEQPAAISFDGQGRMYVLELRSYMLTADAEAELEPTSIISRWEDLDNDGIYETGGTFVDSLVFPRFVLPWSANSVLSMESNQDDVYEYIDRDGDGLAETREFFTGDYGRSGNVEHQQSFLFYGMDNWLYSTYNAFRIRTTDEGVVREPTGYNRGQWGVTQDNYGKVWFQGGASGIPSYFQFPIVYGNFSVDDQLAEGFKIPWGAPIHLEDLQPGMQAVRQPDGSTNQVTGSAGNDVYRGHKLPAAMVGQYFYGEPVARIVRQINPIVKEGITQLHNYYQPHKSEFLRSTDPLFRPVDVATAPDGTLYVVDMYHGIIQEGQWVQKGSYLRTKIEQYQLDKIISLGRIWRIRYQGIERDTTRPNMYYDTSLKLVNYLEHPNGWWRDMAQQEMVRRRDLNILTGLIKMAREHPNQLARIHAIWTLEGLESLTLDQVSDLLYDPDPEIRKTGLRASESLYKQGEDVLATHYVRMMKDPDCEVAIQAMQTARTSGVPGYLGAVRKAKASRDERGIQIVAQQIITDSETAESDNSSQTYSSAEKRFIIEGEMIYQGLCATCHGADGKGIESGGGLMAPALASSPRLNDHPDYLVRVLLHGLQGPIEGRNFSGAVMAPMGSESNEWIAQVSSFVRTHLGNQASLVTPEQVASIRAETEGDGVYAYEELRDLSIRHLIPDDRWKVTASHTGLARIGGSGDPQAVFTFEGWTSGEPQREGMWFQFELPEPIGFSEISFRSPPIWSGRDKPGIQTYPRGYKIEVSMDGEHWNKPVATGDCSDANNHFIFPTTNGRFLRIVQTAKMEDDVPWKMEDLKILGRTAVEHG